MTKLKYFLSICILLLIGYLFFQPNKVQLNKKTVVFWTVQLAPFSDYINNVIEEFEIQNPDIRIKWVDVPYSEAEKRVLATLLSNNMPDLINITSDFNMTLATKGALTQITDTNNFNKELLNSITYNDKVWGIPFYATSAVTIYNKELAQKLNIKNTPKTYDELFDLMLKTQIKESLHLFMPTLTENDTIYKILNKYGYNTHQNINSINTVQFFSNLKNLYINDKFPKESITQTHREVLEKYSSGQIVYLQAGANFLNIIRENSQDIYSKTEVAQQLQGNISGFDYSLMTLAIPLKAKNKQEAILFANYLTNDKNQLEFSKLTGVLPCNKEALSNRHFKEIEQNNLYSKARVIGAMQLLAPINYQQQTKNHKEIIHLINETTEIILLQNKNIQEELNKLKINWDILIKN